MKLLVLPYLRMFDFKGRSRRLEFWLFPISSFLLLLVYFMIVGAIVGDRTTAVTAEGRAGGASLLLLMLPVLALFVPAVALMVRRFHDQDKSGFFLLMGLIPLIGNLLVLIGMAMPGEDGENSYGPDPRDDPENWRMSHPSEETDARPRAVNIR